MFPYLSITLNTAIFNFLSLPLSYHYGDITRAVGEGNVIPPCRVGQIGGLQDHHRAPAQPSQVHGLVRCGVLKVEGFEGEAKGARG